jgi:TolB-like protein
MDRQNGIKEIYEFDQFRLEPVERRLSYGGAPIIVPPKTLDALIVLVQSAGNLLHKEVLHRHLWPDTFVEEFTLARSISDLRAILRKHSDVKYIETVPKHGYRFVGNIQITHALDHGPASRPNSGQALSPNLGPMIAVLPFVVFDDDIEIQIFGDGLAEEIIHTLTCLPGLKVAARGSSFRFRGASQDLKRIGSELGTDLIVQGSIRKAGTRLRVTAQLIDVDQLTTKWSGQFERETGDVLEIQKHIAQAIVEELKCRLDHSSSALLAPPRRPLRTDAWYSYWEGRFHQYRFTPRGLARAELCFERAINIDSEYGLPYLGLAENFHIKANLALARPNDVLPRATEALAKALVLDGDSGETQAAAGVNAVFLGYNWKKAEACFRRALVLSPGSSSVHHLFALWWLRPQGRLEEALDENQLALTLDPLSSFLRVIQAYLFYLVGNETAAIELCVGALGFDANNHLAHRVLGKVAQRQMKMTEANRAYARAVELPGSSLVDLGFLAASYALIGEKEKAAKIRRDLEEELRPGHYRPPTTMAMLDLSLGECDQAYGWLRRSIVEHDPNIIALSTDPLWAAARESQEYDAVLREIGLSPRNQHGITAEFGGETVRGPG